MKDNTINIKYLITSEIDEQWGLVVTSVGFQQICPKQIYPPKNHPDKYLFEPQNGRVLDEYQLLYITRGKGEFTTSDYKKQIIQEGKMFLVFPNERHFYKPDDSTGWDEYWIGFKGDNMLNKVDSNFFTKQKPVLDIGFQDMVVNMYIQAINVAKEQKTGYQQILAGIVECILGYAYSLDKTLKFEEKKVEKLIKKSRLFITENINKRISPEDIASELNISYSYFRKTFKQYTGFSPMQYINEMKIQRSKELLTNTELTNGEIAYMLGFENANYFCTLFKNKTKITPLKYRNTTQGK